jgi:nicotinate phosphoribosyltransferase
MLEAALAGGWPTAGLRGLRPPAAARRGASAGRAAGPPPTLSQLVFGADELAALGLPGDRTRSWLEGRRLGLEVSAYAEGETYTAGSPVLTVAGCFGEGLLLETLVLSVLNHDTAVASPQPAWCWRGGPARCSRWAAGARTSRPPSPRRAPPTSRASP